MLGFSSHLDECYFKEKGLNRGAMSKIQCTTVAKDTHLPSSLNLFLSSSSIIPFSLAHSNHTSEPPNRIKMNPTSQHPRSPKLHHTHRAQTITASDLARHREIRIKSPIHRQSRLCFDTIRSLVLWFLSWALGLGSGCVRVGFDAIFWGVGFIACGYC